MRHQDPSTTWTTSSQLSKATGFKYKNTRDKKPKTALIHRMQQQLRKEKEKEKEIERAAKRKEKPKAKELMLPREKGKRKTGEKQYADRCEFAAE